MREIKFRAWDKKYEVGNDGSVWSLNYNHTGQRRRLHHYLDEGYPYVFLQHNGKRTKLMIHRAVAKLFLPPKLTPKHQVNHKDGNRSNNNINNLEWLTSQENTIHGWKRGRKVSEKQKVAASKAMIKANLKRWHKIAA